MTSSKINHMGGSARANGRYVRLHHWAEFGTSFFYARIDQLTLKKIMYLIDTYH